MHTKLHSLLLGLAALAASATQLRAQGTAFTYQGRLDAGGAPASGSYDLRFTLHDTASGGNQWGPALTNHAVAVSNGLFTTTLDFGFGVFNGGPRWLEIAVRTNGSGAFTPLAPRQALLPTPYAFWAANASQAVTVSGTVPASGLNGLYSNPVNFNNPANSFTGNGAGLSNVNAVTLGGHTAAQFWQTGGNGGTTPGAHFLGTTDNQPLELRVNGQRGLRLEPNPNSPNVVGGSPANVVTNGNYGALIGGGGSAAYPNRVGAPFATVVGGAGNTASANFATAMGQFAQARGYAATALGYASESGGFASVAAGTHARAEHDGSFVWADNTFADFASTAPNQFSLRAAGGVRIVSDPGLALNAADTPLITRGWDPFGSGAPATKQGHGRWGLFMEPAALTLGIPGDDVPGRIFQVAKFDTNGVPTRLLRLNQDGSVELNGPIYSPSGQALTLMAGGDRVLRLEPALGGANVIGGWSGNFVSNGVVGATISGGGAFNLYGLGFVYTNQVLGNFGTVGGGAANTVGENGTVGGGFGNVAGYQGAVGGGWDNQANGGSSTVGGGAHNSASGGYATVAGGVGNSASGNYATAGGGWYNTASGFRATVAGGDGNYAQGRYAAVPGGYANHASGDYSLAAGKGAYATHAGSFVWSDTTILFFGSTASNQFLIHAAGGVGINTATPQAPLHVAGRAVVDGADQWDVNTTEGDLRVGSDTHRFKIGVAQGGGGAGDVWMRAHGGTARVFLKAPGGTTILSNEGQTSGVTLAAGGGAWITLSDRNAKEHFEPVDTQEVLEKVAALPVTRWNYKSQDAGVRHMGPTAQDFRAAFGLGESDTGITTVDADGVALAAIQGLNQKLEVRSRKSGARIEKLEGENAALKAELAELKELVRALVARQDAGGQ